MATTSRRIVVGDHLEQFMEGKTRTIRRTEYAMMAVRTPGYRLISELAAHAAGGGTGTSGIVLIKAIPYRLSELIHALIADTGSRMRNPESNSPSDSLYSSIFLPDSLVIANDDSAGSNSAFVKASSHEAASPLPVDRSSIYYDLAVWRAKDFRKRTGIIAERRESLRHGSDDIFIAHGIFIVALPPVCYIRTPQWGRLLPSSRRSIINARVTVGGHVSSLSAVNKPGIVIITDSRW
jgi:hypothetical protein